MACLCLNIQLLSIRIPLVIAWSWVVKGDQIQLTRRISECLKAAIQS